MQTEPASSPKVWQYRLLAAVLILGAAIWVVRRRRGEAGKLT